MHPQRAGLHIPKGQQVNAPADAEQRHKPQQHRWNRQCHLTPLDTAEAAHKPIGNGRQLVIGVRHQLDIRGSRLEQ